MNRIKRWVGRCLAGMLTALLLTGCAEGTEEQLISEVFSIAQEQLTESDNNKQSQNVTVYESSEEVSESSSTEITESTTDSAEESFLESLVESAADDYVDDVERPDGENENDPSGATGKLDQYGTYTSKDDVALYLDLYDELPDNFITKKEAESLGWTGGSLEPYAPGMCIGGDYFANYEKKLPTKKGRKYYECDIDTLGKKSRGAKRIVFSNDGLIYYTSDHYDTFILLYGEE